MTLITRIYNDAYQSTVAIAPLREISKAIGNSSILICANSCNPWQNELAHWHRYVSPLKKSAPQFVKNPVQLLRFRPGNILQHPYPGF